MLKYALKIRKMTPQCLKQLQEDYHTGRVGLPGYFVPASELCSLQKNLIVPNISPGVMTLW
jgi:hypothetical protein